jgi:hypothetical protein
MSFRFIRDHAGQWPVRLRYGVLEVSPSGYYAPMESFFHTLRSSLFFPGRLFAPCVGRASSGPYAWHDR